MKFEKQMKKHIDEVFEENVPNPYPKKKSTFPRWLKIAMPIGAGVLATSIALAIIVPNVTLNTPNSITPFTVSPVAAPKHKGMVSLDKDWIKRTSPKSLMALDSYFADSDNKNFVLSPASFLLAVSGLIAVSDGFDLDAYGLVDAKADTKALLESMNWYWENDGTRLIDFKSGILHQQVGNKFPFDENKAKAVEESYIATSRATADNYVQQAQQYFKKSVGLTIPVPKVELPDGQGVVTYGALKFMDLSVFETKKNDFYIGDKKVSIDTATLGSINWPMQHLTYFENEQYQTFAFWINGTSLQIILPREGVSLESISVSEAYTNFISSKTSRNIYGYVPYFHLNTDSFDITPSISKKFTGQEKLYTNLLVNENALRTDDAGFYIKALQTSDFEFCEKGVFGETITAIGAGSSSMPDTKDPLLIEVNRPFYAISLLDDFPLFVNKVNNPTK